MNSLRKEKLSNTLIKCVIVVAVVEYAYLFIRYF